MAKKDYTVVGTLSDGRTIYYGKKHPDAPGSRDLAYWVTTTARKCNGNHYVRLDDQLGLVKPADPPEGWKSEFEEYQGGWWDDRQAAVIKRVGEHLAKLDPKEWDRQVRISLKKA